MWILAALLTLGAVYAAALASVLAVRRRPAPLAATIAVAVTICLEACVVHALSVLRAVGRPGLLVGNLIAAALLFAWAWPRRRRVQRLRFRHATLSPAAFLLLALAPLLLFSALAYPPNTWDSMTYHLARVAHWIQHRSVGGFPTAIERQLVYPPGAEYLLLALQGVAGTDRLDGLVQFGSWVIVAAAAPSLARSFGVPSRFAPWTALVAAGGAMAALQASSTGNDLVAAALAVGMVTTCVPFLHRARRAWGTPDVILVVLGVVAGVVTKPVSVVCAAPLLTCAAWGVVRRLREAEVRTALLRVTPFLLLVPAVLLPAAAAGRHARDPAGLFSPFLYLGASEPLDRATNAVRGVLRNLPIPAPALDRLSSPETLGCRRPHALCLSLNAAPLEDVAGSVGPMILVLLGLAAAIRPWRGLPRTARLGIASWCLGWLLFHGTFRDNVWLPRLQLPLFALAPLALGALGRRRGRPWTDALCGLLLAGAAAHAVTVTTLNVKRPLSPVDLSALASLEPTAAWGEIRRALSDDAYYRLAPRGLGPTHAAILGELERTGCRRLSLFLSGDSWEYPLTWRAMRLGVEVRHAAVASWPCAVFTDRGGPPPVPSTRWTAVPGVPSLYLARDDEGGPQPGP